VAPITVVIPLLQLSLVFRLFLSAWVNPHHEVFGLKIVFGTVISMVGACAVAVDSDFILAALPVPYTLPQVLRLSVSCPTTTSSRARKGDLTNAMMGAILA